MSCKRLGTALIVLAATASVSAQTTINFDENGNGTIQNIPDEPNFTVPLEFDGNNPDSTDPGSGLHPATYFLRQSAEHGTPVVGDVLVFESAAGGPLSDLLRFTPDGYLLVYSDLPEAGENPDLADVGIPASRQANLVTFRETGPEGGPNGLFGYTPGINDPGYIAYFEGAVVVYNFTSDTVPEPAILPALGALSAGAVWTSMARRRRISKKLHPDMT